MRLMLKPRKILCLLASSFIVFSIFIGGNVNGHIQTGISINISSIPSEHWMNASWSVMKNKRLKELAIPGTWLEATYGNSTGTHSLMRPIMQDVPVLPPHHHLGIYQLLRLGVRYLDLQVTGSGGHLQWYVKGKAAGSIVMGMEEIALFAQKHPKEVVFIAFSFIDHILDDTRGNYEHTLADIANAWQSLLRSTIGPFLLTLGNRSFENLTFEDLMLGRGKNIILFTNNNAVFPNDYQSKIRFNAALNPHLELANTGSHEVLVSGKLGEMKIVWAFIEQIPSREALGPRIITCICGCTAAFIAGFLLALLFQSRSWRKLHIYQTAGYRQSFFKAAVFMGLLITGLLQTLICLAHRNTAIHNTQISGSPAQTIGGQTGNYGLSDLISCQASQHTLCKLDALVRCQLARIDTNIVIVNNLLVTYMVKMVIAANWNLLPRQINVKHAGPPVQYTGITSLFFTCPSIPVIYVIVSRDEGHVITWARLPPGGHVTLTEGQYPMDAIILVSVGTTWLSWVQLYTGNIQKWINNGQDLYIWGTEDRQGHGYAYISTKPDLRGTACRQGLPITGYLNATVWSPNGVHAKANHM